MNLTDATDSCDWHEPGLSGTRVQAVPSTLQRDALSRVRGSAQGRIGEFTSLGTGGTAQQIERVQGPAELAEAVRQADEEGRNVLVVGGGTNILASERPFAGVVIQDVSRQTRVEADGACGGAVVSATAGQPWDEFVCGCIERDQMGLEALSGIPGSVGAAPVQNIGAYGYEVAETLFNVRVYDRVKQGIRVLPAPFLRLGYRDSLIKRSLTDAQAGGGRTWGPTGRYVVLEASFQLLHASRSAPVKYAQLAKTLGVSIGERVDLRVVREAVLDLRRSKGMVLDPADPDTHSAGSFFTNPLLSESEAAHLPAQAPRFEVRDASRVNSVTWESPVVPGVVKTSAAWLIQHSGIHPGFRLPSAPQARVSSKHVLALTNAGGASGEQIHALAEHIRERVHATFGVWLHPEPVYVGF